MSVTERVERPENEAAAKQLAEDRKATEKSRQDFVERTKGRPTPTQEENDLARLGAHFHEHEPDGSDPDPNVTANKQMEPKKQNEGAGYRTREATREPAREATPRHPPTHSSS
jgi:hypothetical protein